MSGCCAIVSNDANAAGGSGSGSPMALPEQWAQLNVQPNQVQVVLSAQVSTNFDDIAASSAGSAVRLVARLTNPITVAESELDAIFTINGVATALVAQMRFPGSPQIAIAELPVNTVPYVAGDLLGVVVTTNLGFVAGVEPALECWVEVVERAP